MRNCTTLLFGIGLILSSSVANAGSTIADYGTLPNGQAASFSLAGTTVTASADVTANVAEGTRGLGVFGGSFPPLSNFTLDLGETMTIDYGQLVSDVTLEIADISPPGNVDYSFEAFDGASSLGLFPVPAHQNVIETISVSALAGNVPLSRITLSLSASAPAGLHILQTSFTPIPEPGTLTICGIACLLTLARRNSRQK